MLLFVNVLKVFNDICCCLFDDFVCIECNGGMAEAMLKN